MSHRIIPGDCIEAMRGMDEASVDAVVCDPPYGLGFMGKTWDSTFEAGDSPMRRRAEVDAVNAGAARQGGRQRQGEDYQRRMARDSRAFGEWCEQWATEALRVLKPGGHLIAAGSSRTFHRLVCAVEDAGFEIRDTITWHFGSGFPKSLNVSEALRRLPACSCDVANEVGSVDAVPPAGTVGAGVRAEARAVPLAGGAADLTSGVGTNVGTDAPDALSNVDGGVEQIGGNDSPVMLGTSGVAGTAERDEVGSGVGGVEVGPEALRDQVVGDEAGGGTAVGASSVTGNDLGGDGGPSASPVLPLAASPSRVVGAGESLPIGGSHAVAGAVDGDALSVADGLDAADGAGELHKLKCKACGGVRRGAIPEGFGTALKPATEFWTLARKPLSGTVAATVQQFGTGALNVDGCRVAGPKGDGNWQGRTDRKRGDDFNGYEGGWDDAEPGEQNAGGRWPANVILDPEAARLLDEQSGEQKSGVAINRNRTERKPSTVDYVSKGIDPTDVGYGDTGGASRFFYTAKASRAERNAGLEGFEARVAQKWNEGGIKARREETAIPVANVHPTVKPIALMRWLCRLVTPPGGTVLDPFTGSGTTGCAAVLEGFDFVGCEREAEYIAIAEARIAYWAQYPGADTEAVLRSDDQRRRDEGQLDLLREAA